MRISKYLLMTLLTFGLAGTAAFAAAPAGAQEHGATVGELANFDRFLEAHPMIDIELRRMPALVDDARYVARHPELRDFLRDHPGVRRELKSHPSYFMEREERFQHGSPNATFVAIRDFEKFLDTHPEVERDLRRRPILIDDGAYVGAHRELREFLASHPVVAQEIRRDPDFFMQRERALHR